MCRQKGSYCILKKSWRGITGKFLHLRIDKVNRNFMVFIFIFFRQKGIGRVMRHARERGGAW